MVEFTEIDQLWFVVSPQNPFKKKENLLDDYQRLEMVDRAVENDDRFRASNIEFNLPKPSYTIDTLTYLKERHPNYQFQDSNGFRQSGKFSINGKTIEMISRKLWSYCIPTTGI